MEPNIEEVNIWCFDVHISLVVLFIKVCLNLHIIFFNPTTRKLAFTYILKICVYKNVVCLCVYWLALASLFDHLPQL